MPTIVDMRPSANTFRHATLIVIWLVVCLVGLGGCKSNLVKETCIDKPVWTTVVAKDCYTETVNQQTHTVYELTLIADGRDNQFKLRVDKPTYDTMKNNIRIEIFSKAEEDRKRRLEDPIVFRATKVGIVIVSMWGEEASDSMFDKYR